MLKKDLFILFFYIQVQKTKACCCFECVKTKEAQRTIKGLTVQDSVPCKNYVRATKSKNLESIGVLWICKTKQAQGGIAKW